MKEQQSFLKDQLRQEMEKKKELKEELERDHQRILALERQLKEKRRAGRRGDKSTVGEDDPHVNELKTSGTAGNEESELEHKWRWLAAEEERLMELRTAMQWQSEELEERQSVLEKREMALDQSHPPRSETDGRLTSSSGDRGSRRRNNLPTDDKV